jgi:hypothetical protein
VTRAFRDKFRLGVFKRGASSSRIVRKPDMCSWKYPMVVLCIGWALAGVRATPPLPFERHPPRKEPTYQQTPYYCLLVIGPEAKQHWLVVDGETLYLDRRGDGDLTRTEDQLSPKRSAFTALEATLPFIPLGALRGAAGQSPFSNLIFRRRSSEDPKDLSFAIYTDDLKVFPKLRSPFENGVGISIGTAAPLFSPRPQKAQGGIFVEVAKGILARRQRDAPILWFDGPLAMTLSLPDQTFLVRGDQASHLSVQVGTFVTKNGSRVLTLPEIPAAVHPVADIEFPTKEGAKPIRERFVLNERC